MAVDVLSEALKFVRLTGALVFRVDITGPWGIASHPSASRFAPVLPAGTSHIIAFHAVIAGRCWLRQGKGRWLHADAGDVAVLAGGDPHVLCDEPDRKVMQFARWLGNRDLLDLRHEQVTTGPGTTVSLLCGFLGCDRRAFEPMFSGLPPIFTVRLAGSAGALLDFAAAEALNDGPGADGLRVRVAEVMFMEALREYIRAIPVNASGWLAGIHDALVGRALRAIHEFPAENWSVSELARHAACSRSSLASRFRDVVGEPPMHYLTRVRMQLAARYLSEHACVVTKIADRVGYDSSAAFQRAFKRFYGVPPAAWRQRRLAADSGDWHVPGDAAS